MDNHFDPTPWYDPRPGPIKLLSPSFFLVRLTYELYRAEVAAL
jgi:hypothetical protein